MKKLVSIAALTAVVAVALTGAISYATATDSGTAALTAKINRLTTKVEGIDSHVASLRSLVYYKVLGEVKKAHTDANVGFSNVQRETTNLGYEVSSIHRCVVHLNGGPGACTP